MFFFPYPAVAQDRYRLLLCNISSALAVQYVLCVSLLLIFPYWRDKIESSAQASLGGKERVSGMCSKRRCLFQLPPTFARDLWLVGRQWTYFSISGESRTCGMAAQNGISARDTVARREMSFSAGAVCTGQISLLAAEALCAKGSSLAAVCSALGSW